MAHIPPQPVGLPPQPRDPRVALPMQPHYPPTVAEVCKAAQYREHVESSMRKQFPHFPDPAHHQCTTATVALVYYNADNILQMLACLLNSALSQITTTL
jgi:hypothetical protein